MKTAISPATKLVLSYLMGRLRRNKGDEIRPTNAHISRVLGLSEDTISRCIQVLVKEKQIKVRYEDSGLGEIRYIRL